ncbi:MAG: electron transfer flavoprotein subunit alpha/FixB family protein, partial [Candidatus Marinimicrobia bacterium]|nr:electron transfer flavoprotein subunit alpha/FixB family protein [Candidatus Neomarinimicrobiota bacterium]
GKDINQKVSVLAFGKNSNNLSKEAAGFNVNEVILVEDDNLNSYSADAYAETIKQVVEKESPKFVIMGYSYLVRDFFPKVSARLQKPLITDVIGYKTDSGKTLFTKQVIHGKLTVDIGSKVEGPVLIGFQSAAYSADDLENGSADVRTITVTLDPAQLKTTSEEPFQEESGGVDLTAADKIISIGRGIGKEENMPMVKDLATALKAEIGASRPIVDSGWLPNSHQVGSSGQSVTPNLYLALGISGAIQHVVGMKGSKNIVAINRDPDAPIFEVADYGVVGDILEIVPKLTESLKNQ